MKVKSVKRKKTKLHTPVYDLTVPGTENFCLANGMVVHNSKDCSDAMAGAAYGISRMQLVWRRHKVPPRDITSKKKERQNA